MDRKTNTAILFFFSSYPTKGSPSSTSKVTLQRIVAEFLASICEGYVEAINDLIIPARVRPVGHTRLLWLMEEEVKTVTARQRLGWDTLWHTITGRLDDLIDFDIYSSVEDRPRRASSLLSDDDFGRLNSIRFTDLHVARINGRRIGL